MKFGTETYRAGALERLDDARLLLERGRFTASVYMAGLAVEGMLRSLIWLRSREFDERHYLKSMAIRISELGLLRSHSRDSDFVSKVNAVTGRWSNDLRFADEDQFLRNTKLGQSRGQIRKACTEQFESCSEIVDRCEILLKRRKAGVSGHAEANQVQP